MIRIGLTLMELYVGGMIVFSLNSLSVLMFSRRKNFRSFLISTRSIPFWPMAIFSPTGRSLLLNRIGKL